MKKFIIITMLVASAAMFAEVKRMPYSWNGNKCNAWFKSDRNEYFDLSEIADYDSTAYIFDKDYEYELVDCYTAYLYDDVLAKLLQDLLLKYNYVTFTLDREDIDFCIETFMLNSRNEVCTRLWRITAK